MTLGHNYSSALVPLTSIAVLICFWSILSLGMGEPDVLPPPWTVGRMIVAEVASGEMFKHLFATLSRVVMAFIVAMVFGILIGLIMGRSQMTDRLLDPWLLFFLNLPALVVIVLAYLWIGLNEVAAIFAVAVNKIPSVVVTIREGVRALETRFDDLATVYRISFGARLRHVVFPQLAPFIASSARSGVALIWKIVLVVEFLGRSNGIGFQIHLYFQLFDVAMVLAYALSFIAVMLLIETLFVQPLEMRASRWRRT